uniref:Globin domain-containing protein n=1 Tax=Chrysocystis fragilis TaxID=1411660 RepID=A0A7S0TD47_9STRA
MFDDDIGKLILPEEQIELLRECWEKVVALGEERAGVVLFKNIFDSSSEVAQLFSFVEGPAENGEFEFETLARNPLLVKHAVGVIRTVSAVVHMLEEDEMISPILKDLGARHMLYEVKAEHYAIVGAAFLKTMRQALGEGYTGEVDEAFVGLWNSVIAELMQGCDSETVERAKCDIAEACGETERGAFDSAFVARWSEEFVRVDSLQSQASETNSSGAD